MYLLRGCLVSSPISCICIYVCIPLDVYLHLIWYVSPKLTPMPAAFGCKENLDLSIGSSHIPTTSDSCLDRVARQYNDTCWNAHAAQVADCPCSCSRCCLKSQKKHVESSSLPSNNSTQSDTQRDIRWINHLFNIPHGNPLLDLFSVGPTRCRCDGGHWNTGDRGVQFTKMWKNIRGKLKEKYHCMCDGRKKQYYNNKVCRKNICIFMYYKYIFRGSNVVFVLYM